MTDSSNTQIIILPDHETKVDLLNNEPIAKTISELISHRPKVPVTVGVHGDWGAGKSSILEMVEYTLSSQPKTLCIKFNGWTFQGFEDAKIALLEGVVDALVKERSLLTNAAEKVKSIFRRIDWLRVAKNSGGLAWTAFTGIPTLAQLQGVVSMLQGVVDDPSKALTIFSKENAESAAQLLSGALKETDSKHLPEEVQEFRKEFDELLSLAGLEQLVVLVDDLDRCLPDTTIETLEAIRLFVLTSRTAFVIAADEAMIEYCVRKHFPDLPESTGPRSYARNYLEKLIQVPFRIPALGVTETRIYISLLLVGASVGEETKQFEELISLARERLKKPWEGNAITFTDVQSALKQVPQTLQELLMVSEQISPLLADGTFGNPRQIKRFLNSLLLRQRIALARGFGTEINVPVLAKLMLVERFQSKLFEHIAQSASKSPKGICDDLLKFESDKKKDTDTNTKSSSKEASISVADQHPSQDWLQSESVITWAKLNPPLANVDLRPYLFIIKDRRGYGGNGAIPQYLEEIGKQLCHSELAVKGIQSSLSSLRPEELNTLFNFVQAQILQTDNFTAKPAGIFGLIALAKLSSTLQSRLLDFLESLPRARLGVWATGGWSGVFTDPSINQRYTSLIDSWKQCTDNPALVAAIHGAGKISKRGR